MIVNAKLVGGLYMTLISLLDIRGLALTSDISSKRNFSSSEAKSEETLICPQINDIDTSLIFPTFNFNASWISKKYFWHSDDFNFESRYQNHLEDLSNQRETVKVIILPFSHTDPGWLVTYDQYYFRQTRNILNNIVNKLTEHPQMTFIWNEITYLAKWWKDANTLERQRFKKLLDEGRLEIVTGAWVMSDEATPSLYALVSQITEGQQFVKNNLNHKATYSWQIDPFGYSGTYSHLLKLSGIEGMVVQRLHYGFKHYLAEHRSEEFVWRPRWDTEGTFGISCLTLPFDLYSIKHACGPQPSTCLKFDFRRVSFEYGENYGIMTPITKSNIRQLAGEIVAQYHKSSSLMNHNYLLVPLGDDFRYDHSIEWDQQYENYMRLFSHINSHKEKYKMEIAFGTLRDYFEGVKTSRSQKRLKEKSLVGDFLPYGDVYVSGKPSYWTGYYGSRPYWKKFHRELENELRSAEILFTFANNLARQSKAIVEMKTLSYQYMDLTKARQNFALFTHHDGITGTSRRWTMQDYGDRLHSAYQTSIGVQIQSLKILHKLLLKKTLPVMSKPFLRERFENLPENVPLEIFSNEEYLTRIMIFNNLGRDRTELIKVFVKSPQVLVLDKDGNKIESQINPIFMFNEPSSISISNRMYELAFLASLNAFSFSTFQIKKAINETDGVSTLSQIYCPNCSYSNDTLFPIEENLENDTLTIEDMQTRLHFQNNGLLEKIEMKGENKTVPVALSFGVYKPANRQSGAYLLKPILSQNWQFFQTDQVSQTQVIRIRGPVLSQVISAYSSTYEVIKVNTTLIHQTTPRGRENAVSLVRVDTFVDFSRDYSHKLEAYMRLETGINSTNGELNGSYSPVPVIYTDQNGFVVEKRSYVPAIGYEGNTFPVTSMTYIQEDSQNETVRFSVLVDRTHGFVSMQKGRLETLIERKSLYDDGRGLSEGVTDSKPTVSSYIFLLEKLQGRHAHGSSNGSSSKAQGNKFSSWQPTMIAHESSLKLNYPPNLFVYNEPNYDIASGQTRPKTETLPLIASPLPENVHLLTMRTLSNETIDINTASNNEETATKMALINLQHFAVYGSNLGNCQNHTWNSAADDEYFKLGEVQSFFQIKYLNISKVTRTSLTGIGDSEYMDDANTTHQSSLLSNFKILFK